LAAAEAACFQLKTGEEAKHDVAHEREESGASENEKAFQDEKEWNENGSSPQHQRACSA
jgi:hypothetical protein